MFKTVIDIIGYLNYLKQQSEKVVDIREKNFVLTDVLAQCEPSWTKLTEVAMEETAIYKKKMGNDKDDWKVVNKELVPAFKPPQDLKFNRMYDEI